MPRELTHDSEHQRPHNVADVLLGTRSPKLAADAMEPEELGGLPLRNDVSSAPKKCLPISSAIAGETRDVAGQNLKMTRDLELILEGWRQELMI